MRRRERAGGLPRFRRSDGVWQGQDSNLGRRKPAILQVAIPAPLGSLPIPIHPRPSAVTSTNGLPIASAVTRRPYLFRRVPRGLASGGGKVEGNPGRCPARAPDPCGVQPMGSGRWPTGPLGPTGVHTTPLALSDSCPKRSPAQVRGFEILPNAGTDQRQIGNSSHRPGMFLICLSHVPPDQKSMERLVTTRIRVSAPHRGGNARRCVPRGGAAPPQRRFPAWGCGP
jgi:hypothetical protein